MGIDGLPDQALQKSGHRPVSPAECLLELGWVATPPLNRMGYRLATGVAKPPHAPTRTPWCVSDDVRDLRTHHGAERIGRHGLSEVEPLTPVAPQLGQDLVLGHGLHPFTGNGEAEEVGQLDGLRHDGMTVPVRSMSVTKLWSILTMSKGKLLEVAERRIAGTEVIQGQA